MEWVFLIFVVLLFWSKSFRAGIWGGLTSRGRKRHKHSYHRDNYTSRKSVTYKSAKGVASKAGGGGNPWQKKNAKYAKQDAKRHERQMRTGNK